MVHSSGRTVLDVRVLVYRPWRTLALRGKPVAVADSLFIAACRGDKTARPPIWMMRQAGRYLPEYREIRKNVSFLDLCKNPELAAEVTMQPIRRFGFDAAILFSDLLVPLEPMGLNVAFTEQGPTIDNPVTTPDDVERLRMFDPLAETPYVPDTIKTLVPQLGETPLIGFAGAPFTVATYAIEGRTSKRFLDTRRFMYNHPEATGRLFTRLADATFEYMKAQVDAGVQALQLFDSWVGILSSEDWDRYVLEPTRDLVQRLRTLGVPIIYFANGASTIFDRVAKVGADVYGVDWRLPLSEARARLTAGAGKEPAVQGNLDPALLIGPKDRVVEQAKFVIAQGERRGHVFNLGHGISPDASIGAVEALVDTVKSSG